MDSVIKSLRFPLQELKNYITSTIALLLFAILIVHSTTALSVTCEAGGPYAKNATINVLGNVSDNSQGALANVSANISRSGTEHSSSDTTSDASGAYHTSHFLDLDFNTYDVAVSATANSTTVYCTDTIDVELGVNVSCANRLVRVEGIALYSHNASYVITGTVTAGIAEVSAANSSSLNSTGGFSVPVTACLKKGARYTLNVFVDDNYDKRSFLQQKFVAP